MTNRWHMCVRVRIRSRTKQEYNDTCRSRDPSLISPVRVRCASRTEYKDTCRGHVIGWTMLV